MEQLEYSVEPQPARVRVMGACVLAEDMTTIDVRKDPFVLLSVVATYVL